MSLFGDLAAGWPDKDLVAGLAGREVPVTVRVEQPGPLSPDVAIVDVFGTPDCDVLLEEWPDRRTARSLAEAVHGLELERASRPPQLTVSVPGPAPAPAPVSRNVLQTTPQLRRRLRRSEGLQ